MNPWYTIIDHKINRARMRMASFKVSLLFHFFTGISTGTLGISTIGTVKVFTLFTPF